jgi:hypothetical protein
MHGIHLTHEVLDAQLIDRNKEKIGRVDALELELRPDQPLRVATIVIGGPARAERIGRVMVWISRALRALARVRSSGVSRIPFSAVRCIGDTIALDVDGCELESGHVERWLADHIVCRIPGSREKDE